MNIKKYVSKQFGKPTGIGGAISTYIMNVMNQKQYKCIINNLNCSIDDKILDIGFGNGYLINNLAKKNKCNFYGIEISDDMIKAASKRNFKSIQEGKVSFVKGSVENIPFDDNFFDKIYTVNTVYFWRDLNKSLQEVKRVLKPGGLFVNVIYSKYWLDKIRYTKYGFSKYIPSKLEEITLNNGFKINQVIEIKKDISYCIIGKKDI